MTTLPNLPLVTWDSGNTQPELLYNALLAVVDALIPNPVVIDKDLTSPPSSPVLGSLYIVGSPATGLWEGKENQLVAYSYNNAWLFIPPKPEWSAYVTDEDEVYRYNGTAWVVDSSGGTGFTNPMTTPGDLIVGGTAGAPTRLGIGANGTKLGVVAGALAYVADVTSYGTPVTALSIASGVVNIDLSLGDYFTLTLTANVTSITFSNLPASGLARTINVRIRQDATGSRTVALPSSFKAISGSDTAVQSAANAYTELFATSVDQGTRWAYSMKGEAA